MCVSLLAGHGLSGQVQNSFFKFDSEGQPAWDLKGKDLLTGETDGSSYLNGGLRGTHCAGGYVAMDPTSPIWLRGDTIFIPSCLVSYYGAAIDEKRDSRPEPLFQELEVSSGSVLR